MKNLKTLLALAVALFVSTAAFAASEPKVESYSHPTMFGSQVQQTVEGTQTVYVVGENKVKSTEQISVNGKQNVLIDSWVKDILALLKSNCKVFNPKMPILRSEMAVVLSEGLNIKTVKPRYKYLDIASNYWAKPWIDKALAEGVMIGYPDKKFRPDQPITKAEVFATLAQLINVPVDKSKVIPSYKGYKMQQIPCWAIKPTKEVLASKLMDEIPEPEKAAKSKYLTKEQVAYLVGALRQNYIYNSKFANGKYLPTCVSVKMDERVDVRHSNIGDTFYATTTKATMVKNKPFAVGSKVKGEVVEVSRPGLKNPGYIKVRFDSIKCGNTEVKFPKNISSVNAKTTKNTNPVARLFAAPFSASARVAGVAGRTASSATMVASNGIERYGDDISNAFANLFSLQPKASARSLGKSFVTAYRGTFDVIKLLGSGAFGVVYEFCDEAVYLVLPCKSNSSGLNPGEELVVIY